MTDRYSSLTIVLENDIREDDAEALIAAIKQLRGVLSVHGNVSDSISELVAGERVRSELTKELFEALNKKPGR